MKTVKFPQKSSVVDKKRAQVKEKVKKKMALVPQKRLDIPLGPTPQPQQIPQNQMM